MMNSKSFAIFFALLGFSLELSAQSQVSGQVVDEEGLALPFVNVTINGGKQGFTTDLDGEFSYPRNQNLRSLHFSYIGFESQVIEGPALDQKPLRVVMVEKSTALDEVTVFPGDNPAHRMVNNAVANKGLNDPNKLESFSYFSYSKFMVSMDVDSIDPSIDTVMLSDRLDSLQADTLSQDSIVAIDSSNFELKKFFSQRHLFFMETLTERKVRKPRDNETVLAQRASGFRNPMFALLVTQLQSFSFYEDYIGISGGEYLNPISKGSTNRYFFIIEDSLFTPSGDTIFTISFRPKPNKSFNALEGVISLDSRDWAIRNVRAVPAQEGGFPIQIRQEYKRYGPHTWFPTSFEADVDLGMVSVNGSNPQAIMRRKLMRIDLNPDLDGVDIPRVELSIEEKDDEVVDSLLALYRTDDLDSLEQDTYAFLDSISEAENLEQQLGLLLTLSRGYIPWGYFNFDIAKIANYNVYEGFRLGVDIETNSKLSDWFSVGVYGAYGFKDREWKYGGRFKIELHKNTRWEIYGTYNRDLYESAAFEIPYLQQNSVLQNNYRRLYLEQWDLATIMRGGMRLDPFPTLRVDLSIAQEQRQTIGNYQFLDLEANQVFGFTEAQFGLRFAPEEEYAETPFGKIRIKQSTPVFQVFYARGLDQLEGDFNYDRLIFQGDWRRLSRGYGETFLSLRLAKTWGEVPYTKLFSPQANFRNVNDFVEANFGSVADRNSFETMRFNEFLADELVTLMWRQDFRSTLFRKNDFAPHIEIVNRVAWGRLTDATNHRAIGTKDLEDPYFESGLELNKLYNPNFFGFGLGIYYRYGANQLPEAIDNFAFKLTSKFSF